MKQKLLSTIVISAVALTTSLSANAANVYKDDNSKLDVIGVLTAKQKLTMLSAYSATSSMIWQLRKLKMLQTV